MRKNLITGLILILGSSTMGQTKLTRDEILPALLTRYQYIERSEYNCNSAKTENLGGERRRPAATVNPFTFDTLFQTITSRVILTTEGLVKNGTAASVTFAEASKKLSINKSWRPKNSKETYLNVGFTAENATSKLFEIYNKSGWVQGIGASFGGTKLTSRTLLFMEDACSRLTELRQQHMKSVICEYSELLKTDTTDISTKKDRYDKLNILTASVSDIINNCCENFNSLRLYDSLSAVLTNARRLYGKAYRDEKGIYGLDTLIREDITAFEKKNFKDHGFKLHWLNYGLNLNFKALSIYDTAVRRLADVKKKNFIRITANVTYNFARESARSKGILYFSIGLTVGNTNYLEEILPSEISILKEANAPTSSEIKETFNALVLKDYNTLKKDYGVTTIPMTLDYFFGKERFFGLELQADYKYKFNIPDNVPANHSFSVKGGLLFSFEGKEKLSTTTFGIIAAFNNIPVNDISAKDRFTLGVRVGIPFNF